MDEVLRIALANKRAKSSEFMVRSWKEKERIEVRWESSDSWIESENGSPLRSGLGEAIAKLHLATSKIDVSDGKEFSPLHLGSEHF
jgi:hypothetical protein